VEKAGFKRMIHKMDAQDVQDALKEVFFQDSLAQVIFAACTIFSQPECQKVFIHFS